MPYYRNAIHNLTLWKSAYVVVVLGRQGTDYHTSLHHQLTFYIVMFKKTKLSTPTINVLLFAFLVTMMNQTNNSQNEIG